MILATRHGFHGKKGLAGAVTGCETDHDRDPRVRFISFPMTECADVARRDEPFDAAPYQRELDALWQEFGPRLGVLITEPYLGSAGSYHPPAAYLRLLEAFCRKHDLVFILDEVQSNFGRTRELFAYETYGIEPDIVVLGKGLGNGVPVAAAVGRADVLAVPGLRRRLRHVERQPAVAVPPCWRRSTSSLPATCYGDVGGRRPSSRKGLLGSRVAVCRPCARRTRRHGLGRRDARSWRRSAADWANAAVLACYRGESDHRRRRDPHARPAGEERAPHRTAVGHHRARGGRRNGTHVPAFVLADRSRGKQKARLHEDRRQSSPH